MTPPRPEHVASLRADLTDLRAVLEALGLKARREGAGFKILCPWHGERSASCAVRIGPDHTLQARCHACGRGGDVFSLIAAARGYPMPSGFRDVLLEAAPIAGRWDIVDELEGRAPAARRPAVPRAPRLAPPPPAPTLDADTYAAIAEALLDACPLRAQPDACAYLDGRRIFADAEARGLKALPGPDAQGPLFASLASQFGVESLILAGLARDSGDAFRASAWRLLIPWRDRAGRVLSVQRRVLGKPPGDAPKYLFPRGRAMPSEPFGAECFDAALSSFALAPVEPSIVFTEGALDALAAVAINRREPRPFARIVLGIPSATSWRGEWSEYARGRDVHIALDDDPAGDTASATLAADLAAVARRIYRELPPLGAGDIGEALQRSVA